MRLAGYFVDEALRRLSNRAVFECYFIHSGCFPAVRQERDFARQAYQGDVFQLAGVQKTRLSYGSLR